MIKLFTSRFRYEKACHRKQSFTFTPNSINNYRTRMTIRKSFLQLIRSWKNDAIYSEHTEFY